jgi:hypothetical protein
MLLTPILVPAIKRQLTKKPFTDADSFEDFVCNDFFVPERYELVAAPNTIVLADSIFKELNFKQISSAH